MRTLELDLRSTQSGELFARLTQAYMDLSPGDVLRAILGEHPRDAYMAFVETGVAHRVSQAGAQEWQWSATRKPWDPMKNGPGVHHVGISPDGLHVYAVDRDRTVFLLDTRRERMAGSVRLGKGTSHLAVHPGSGRVYVAEGTTNTMVRLNGATLAVEGRVSTGQRPIMPMIDDDGRVVVLPGRNSMLTLAYDRPELEAVNLEMGGRPSACTTSHDGRRAYIPDTARNLLVTVDLEERQVLSETPAGDGPAHPIVTPDDKVVCIANSRSHDVTLVDAQTFDVLCTIPSGEAAHQTSMTPDGKTLLVANFFEDSVSIIDLPSRTRVGVVPVGPYPHGLDIAPGGQYAIATHFGDEAISVIDVAARKLAARLPAGLGSAHTAFSAENNRAYVTNGIANTVTVVDLERLEATAEIPVS